MIEVIIAYLNSFQRFEKIGADTLAPIFGRKDCIYTYWFRSKTPQASDVKANQELAITIVVLVIHVIQLRNDVLVV